MAPPSGAFAFSQFVYLGDVELSPERLTEGFFTLASKKKCPSGRPPRCIPVYSSQLFQLVQHWRVLL